jgi:uncharacterized protein YjbJ (UPF0337 family)
MTEDAQNLQQQIQQLTVRSAQEFYGNSLGRLKGQLQSDRAQLESLAEQVPDEEAQAQIQELVDSYEAIESSLDQSAQDLGVMDTLNQALGQAQEAAGGVAQQAQDVAGGAAQQAQGAVGQVAGQAGQLAQGVQDTAGQVADQVQEVADQVQEVAGQAQEVAGQAQEVAGQAAQQAYGGLAGNEHMPDYDYTEAAWEKAQELGVDLSQVEGSGAGGRITVKDVQSAANQG